MKSQSPDASLLDGVELDYTYSSGGHLITSFYAGQLKYRWLSGPFEGVEESDLTYKSKKIGPEQYVINWHDLDNSNFVTLIIDLEKKVLHSCALLYYGTEKEVTSFDGAIINSIKRTA
jgi:hypothetical protein